MIFKDHSNPLTFYDSTILCRGRSSQDLLYVIGVSHQFLSQPLFPSGFGSHTLETPFGSRWDVLVCSLVACVYFHLPEQQPAVQTAASLCDQTWPLATTETGLGLEALNTAATPRPEEQDIFDMTRDISEAGIEGSSSWLWSLPGSSQEIKGR